jgi:hypothetical protein
MSRKSFASSRRAATTDTGPTNRQTYSPEPSIMTDRTTVNESLGQLRAIETELGALFIEREEVVRAMLIPLANSENGTVQGAVATWWTRK